MRALAISGSDLYLGGDFTNAGGIAGADKVARWNGSSWSSLGSSIDVAGMAVYSVLVDQGTVVIAGYMNNAEGWRRPTASPPTTGPTGSTSVRARVGRTDRSP